MGNDSSRPGRRRDQPAHPVTLSDFYMQETEVTNGEMEAYFHRGGDRPREAAQAVAGGREGDRGRRITSRGDIPPWASPTRSPRVSPARAGAACRPRPSGNTPRDREGRSVAMSGGTTPSPTPGGRTSIPWAYRRHRHHRSGEEGEGPDRARDPRPDRQCPRMVPRSLGRVSVLDHAVTDPQGPPASRRGRASTSCAVDRSRHIKTSSARHGPAVPAMATSPSGKWPRTGPRTTWDSASSSSGRRRPPADAR